MRYDLAFFLCCCKSFLSSSTQSATDYYELLGVERDATPDDIKRAYKRQSLQMHPDKLAQRGKQVTDADQAQFQKMKEAYEVLSDPHKRETYDAIGERGLKWLEEPFSMDPQEMAHNFANSSTLDRSKIFAIFVGIAVTIFLLPILICLRVDGKMGDAPWTAVLTPLWILDAIVLFYHARVINMGPIAKPDGVSDDEWVDPLPMSKRYFSLFRFLLLCAFEILAALQLDGFIRASWALIFVPVYVHEITTLYKKIPLARMKIVTVEDLETALGKPFSDFTPAEKDLISRKYSVVPSIDSPEFETAHKIKGRARQDIIKLAFRAIFMAFVITQLQTEINWNWWLIFVPFWLMSFCICCGSAQKFAEAQNNILEKDPQMFASMTGRQADEENSVSGSSNYGAMEDKESGAKKPVELSDHEKEELKTQFLHAGYKMVGSCCSQGFLLLIVSLFVGKLQGAGYSSVWIISPLLFVAGIILCCLGCTIFCITDVTEESADFEPVPVAATAPAPAPAPSSQDYVPPTVPQPPTANPGDNDKAAPKATWDPEKGQIWEESMAATPGSPLRAPPPATIPEHKTELKSTVESGEDVALLTEPTQPTDRREEDTATAIHELD